MKIMNKTGGITKFDLERFSLAIVGEDYHERASIYGRVLVDKHIYREHPLRTLLTQLNDFFKSMNAMYNG